MKRVWMRALWILALGSCGDSVQRDERESGVEREADASAGAGADGGQQRNLGEACEPSEAAQCRGTDAKCLTELKVLSNTVEFVDGYCSLACEVTEDCGPGGDCPVGETRAELAGTPMATLFESLPSNCLKRCEDSSECRTAEGYACQPMTSALPDQLGALVSTVLADRAITKKTFCVPVKGDAGSR